jgi:hypothetical protein
LPIDEGTEGDFVLLPDVAGHDEWLLDEALAETFPASDSIAVSPHSLASDKPA